MYIQVRVHMIQVRVHMIQVRVYTESYSKLHNKYIQVHMIRGLYHINFLVTKRSRLKPSLEYSVPIYISYILFVACLNTAIRASLIDACLYVQNKLWFMQLNNTPKSPAESSGQPPLPDNLDA